MRILTEAAFVAGLASGPIVIVALAYTLLNFVN
jgi:hypothetical protein